MPPLREGDVALLVDRSGRRRTVRLRAGGRLHTNKGVVEHDQLIDAADGALIRTSTGAPFTVWRPRLMDWVLEMPRQTGIIYPKDAAVMLLWGDVFPGATVLEAGIGSGALTQILLRAVGREGRVISYDTRADFIALAMNNIRAFDGEPCNLLVRERDVTEGIVDADIDRIILDVPEPWRVIPGAIEALVPGGILVAFTPSIVQVDQTVTALHDCGWFERAETLESLYRPWHVDGQAIRPVQQMVGHTGFLTFARKLAQPWRRGAVDPLLPPDDAPIENESESTL